MVSITISVPPETKQKMDTFPEINWSGFVRKTIEEKVKSLFWKEEMLIRLKEEQPIIEWSLELQKKARKGRYAELKKSGLVQ